MISWGVVNKEARCMRLRGGSSSDNFTTSNIYSSSNCVASIPGRHPNSHERLCCITRRYVLEFCVFHVVVRLNRLAGRRLLCLTRRFFLVISPQGTEDATDHLVKEIEDEEINPNPDECKKEFTNHRATFSPSDCSIRPARGWGEGFVRAVLQSHPDCSQNRYPLL